MSVTTQYRTVEAEREWRPRVEQAVAAWRGAERESVARGIRRCGLDVVPIGEVEAFSAWAVASDLVTQILSVQAAPEGYSARVRHGASALRIGYGRDANDVRRLAAAYAGRDDDELGRLFGFPRCCVESFCNWWPCGRTAPDYGRGVVVDGFFPHTNIQLRHLGVRAVPHLPCSPLCRESERSAEDILDCLETRRDVDDLLAVLSLPVDYSVVGGVVRAETPHFTVASDADGEPDCQIMLGRPEHAVNGFSSWRAMSEAHSAVVVAAHRDDHYNDFDSVLDLGCGSGRLSRLVAAYKPGGVQYGGVDSSPDAVDVARALNPGGGWSVGDAIDYRRDDNRQLALVAVSRIPPYLVGPAVVYGYPGPGGVDGGTTVARYVPVSQLAEEVALETTCA